MARHSAHPLNPWARPPVQPSIPAPPPGPTPADRLATAIAALLLPALLVPLIIVLAAAGPQLTLASGAVAPGSRVTISGERFAPSNRMTLELDGERVARVNVNRSGTFSTTLRLPRTLAAGEHTLAARSNGAVVASMALTVPPTAQAAAPASAAPTATPAPTPATTPRVTPTPVPTPRVTPTPVPTPSPAAATPAPTPPPAPAAGPMVAGGRVFFLSPSGTDVAAGTVSAPWRSLPHAASLLRPGDTLYVRGGTYVGQGMQWTISGTAAAPIWVKAYPGERPVFDGNAAVGQFLWFRGGAGYIYIDGLTVTRYAPRDSGVMIFTDGAHDIVMQNLNASGNFGSTQNEHVFYPAAAGVHDITIRYSFIAGATGGAVHMFHEPGPQRVRIYNNTIRDSYWGVVADSGASAEVFNNTFINNGVNIVRIGGATVAAWGNSPNDAIQ